MSFKNSDMQFTMKVCINSKHPQRSSYKSTETKRTPFIPIDPLSSPNKKWSDDDDLSSSTTVYSFTTGTTFMPSSSSYSGRRFSRSSLDSPPSSPTSSTSNSAPGSSSSPSLKRPAATFFATSFTFKPIDEADREEVTCEFCGKIYKHRNCLTKHQWEHHEHWETTKRLCVSKHQQVQLLEAATVLINITSTSPIIVL